MEKIDQEIFELFIFNANNNVIPWESYREFAEIYLLPCVYDTTGAQFAEIIDLLLEGGLQMTALCYLLWVFGQVEFNAGYQLAKKEFGGSNEG